jgi:polar amino acid transport system substrate-binding protein
MKRWLSVLVTVLTFCVWAAGAAWAGPKKTESLSGNFPPSSGRDSGVVDTLQLSTPATINPVAFPQDIQQIKDRGRLIVAMFHQDRPPFFYTNDEGRLVGLDVEIAREIARWLGVEVEFNREAQSFDGVVDLVANGKADIGVSKLSTTMPRVLRVSFTQPYLVFHHALLINRLQLASLKAKNPEKSVLELLKAGPNKIGVRGASSWIGYAQTLLPDAHIVHMENMEQLLAAVARGDFLALMYDEYEVKKIITGDPGLNVEMQLLILDHQVDPIGIAVAPNSPHLLAWLNFFLQHGMHNLKMNSLLREYGMAGKEKKTL